MLEKIKTAEVPKLKRNTLSRFERMPEWEELKAVLQSKKGIKPGESYQIKLSEEEKAAYGINNRRVIYRFLERYFSENTMPYQLRTFERDGFDYVVIDGPSLES